MGIALEKVEVLQCFVSACESGLDIPKLERRGPMRVPVLTLVDRLAGVRQALLDGQIGWQLLVPHLDQVERRLGGLLVNCRDGRDGVAYIANFVTAERLLIL